MRKLTLALCSLAVLAGCSLAPEYRRPPAPTPAAYPFSGDDANARSISPVAWPEFFGEARVRRLIEVALENNRDLRVAGLRVERIRALYDIQRFALIPSLDATAAATRQRSIAEFSGSGQALTTSRYQVGLMVPAYELDFFGRVASLRDQVLQQYLATEEARRSAELSLVAAVARQYFALRAIDEQVALARQTLAAAQRAYELIRQTFEAGVASELDLSAADAQRQAVRAALAAAEQRRDEARNALALLIGSPLPEDLPPAGTLATQNLIDDLPAGLPSDLLARRPDILAAERRLQAANANIGVARAAFFPAVKLTAFGGFASPELDGLFDSASEAWSFTPSITLPIFASGQNKALLKVAKVDTEIEVANYEKAIQTAFREVSDALAARLRIRERIEAQAARVSAAQRRYDLSSQRFEAGTDGFLTVLLAQQDLYAAQQSLIQARLLRLANLTDLYAALGG